MAGGLVASAIGASVLTCAVAIMGALLPVYFSNAGLKTAGSFCFAFAAGAFFSLGVFHILPDAVEGLAQADLQMYINGQPHNTAYIFLILGYIFVFFFSRVLCDESSALGHSHGATCDGASPIGVHHTDQHTEGTETCSPTEDVLTTYGVSASTAATENTIQKTCVASNEGELESGRSQNDHLAFASEPLYTAKVRKQKSNESMTTMDEGREVALFWKYMLTSGAFYLMVALGVHSFCEGMITGMAPDAASMWLTTAVIVGHKWAESFALTSSFMEYKIPKKYMILLLTVFVLATPVGIIAGLFCKTLDGGAPYVANAFGAGTVLYIASELAEEVFSPGGPHRLVKFALYTLGITTVCLLTVLSYAVE